MAVARFKSSSDDKFGCNLAGLSLLLFDAASGGGKIGSVFARNRKGAIGSELEVVFARVREVDILHVWNCTLGCFSFAIIAAATIATSLFVAPAQNKYTEIGIFSERSVVCFVLLPYVMFDSCFVKCPRSMQSGCKIVSP